MELIRRLQALARQLTQLAGGTAATVTISDGNGRVLFLIGVPTTAVPD